MFAGILWVLGLRLGAGLVVVAVVALSLISVACPTRGKMIDAGIARVTAWVGRFAATILLAIVYFVVITPASLVLRLFGRDPLFSPGISTESTWVARPFSTDSRMFRHQFTVEPGASGVALTKRRGRVATAGNLLTVTIGSMIVFMALDLGVGTAYVSARAVLDTKSDNTDIRASTPALVDEEWAADYFNELREASHNWEPLLGMLRQDYEGRYINIADRARKTYSAEEVGGEATVVYFFGGSTTWGTGQRDLYTIPSNVARLAEKDGVEIRVSNYGQGGWVIWQQLSLMLQLLAEGKIPDLAVFYNGHNDVGQQVQELTTVPSYPRAALLKQKVEAVSTIDGTIADLTDYYRKYSILHHLVVRIAGKPSGSVRAPAPALASARASNAVTLHNEAVELIERLAESYGFEAVFIWQPDAYTTEGGDAERFATQDREGFGNAYRDATELVGAPVINLADSLNGVTDAVFFDDVHTNELGAQIVAKAIYPHLQPHLGRQ